MPEGAWDAIKALMCASDHFLNSVSYGKHGCPDMRLIGGNDEGPPHDLFLLPSRPDTCVRL